MDSARNFYPRWDRTLDRSRINVGADAVARVRGGRRYKRSDVNRQQPDMDKAALVGHPWTVDGYLEVHDHAVKLK